MTNLYSMLKSKDITWWTKFCITKTMVFPVVIYSCESWTIKKTDGQRIDAFELWCWRRFLRVPWTARSNQSILRGILFGRTNAEAPILWPPHAKSQLIGKDLDWARLRAGKEVGDRG